MLRKSKASKLQGCSCAAAFLQWKFTPYGASCQDEANKCRALLRVQVDGLTRLMLGAASEDKEKVKHRKENRRETWAPGLGRVNHRVYPSPIILVNSQTLGNAYKPRRALTSFCQNLG